MAVPFGAVTPFGGDFIIVSLKEVKNYLRVDFDDDDALIRQLMDTAHKLCMETVRTDDISVLQSDKKTYKTAVLYAVAYLFQFCNPIRKHTKQPYFTLLHISTKIEKNPIII